MFRRARFTEVIAAQLDLFVGDQRDLLAEAARGSRRYNRADRDDAEELYGDYVDAVETGDGDPRRHARPLRAHARRRRRVLREFNRAVAQRWPAFALEIENR